MRIEINPRTLLNLENICQVLYKLHPSVLDYLISMERSLGKILGTIDLDNVSLEEREFLSNNFKEEDFSKEPKTQEEFYKMLESKGVKVTTKTFDNIEDVKKYIDEYKSNNPNVKILNEYKDQEEEYFPEVEDKYNSYLFHNLRKYIQLDTDEYIPMKISVEVEDPVIGKKVKELVEALEKTRAPEQFYLNKKELDEDAYFAGGYGLTMNEEQKKKLDDFFWGADVEDLERLLRKEKLYP